MNAGLIIIIYRRISNANIFCQSDNDILGSDAGHRFPLPFELHTKATATKSPRHYKKSHSDSTLPPPPPPRNPHHNVNTSHLARRNAYSNGINVNNLYPPPPRRRRNYQTAETASSSSPPQSTSSGVSAVASIRTSRSSGQCPNPNEKSAREAAKSRLRELCMDILQSAKEGTSPPQRAEIKEAVVGYHLSRNNAISPRDKNFTEIPPEFSQVLTYGLARSQARTVQQVTPVIEEPDQQLYNDTNHQQTVVKGRARRSRFSEIKDEGEGQHINESWLHSTIELGPSDMVSCLTLPSSIGSNYYNK